MNEKDRAEFAQVVRATFNNYGREAPMQETLRMWWGLLAEFEIVTVRLAFSRHVVSDPKYPPTIGQILEILNAGNKAGRLGAEEAWAVAVKACDETETVVMNDEIAQAWGICKPIMDLGDEVGARMAFKEAYQRITAAATEPVKWWPSIGSDPHKRDAALSVAKRQGLLPAPYVAALLPPPMPTKATGNPEGLQRVKDEIAKMNLSRMDRVVARDASVKADRDAVIAAKRAIAERIEKYRKGAQQ